jgi:hypothetical protein
MSAVLLREILPEGFKGALAHQETKGVAAFGFLLKSGIWRYLICKAMSLRTANIVDRKVSCFTHRKVCRQVIQRLKILLK